MTSAAGQPGGRVALRMDRQRRRHWLLHLTRFLLLYVGIPYMAICALFVMFQRRLMYPARVVTTADLEMLLADQPHVQSVRVRASDDVQINGFIYQSSVTGQAEKAAKDLPLVLYFPGNGGCRVDRLELCECFAARGCRVALFDYRGYGENLGTPSERAIHADAQAIWNYLTKTRGIPAHKIILYGESLGGAVATRLAANVSRAGTPPAALLLSATFSSMTDVASWHYPWLPVRWFLIDSYDSQAHLKDVTCPMIAIHGTHDGIVPLAIGQRLYDSVKESASPRRFIKVPGAGHNDLPVATLCRALDELLGLARGRLESSEPSVGESAADLGDEIP